MKPRAEANHRPHAVLNGHNGREILRLDAKPGSVVKIQDADGKPIAGYSLDDGEAIYGGRIRHVVRWGAKQAKSADVSGLAGQPIRLRFVMQKADLYSLKSE